jgi:hypothetical protein
VLTVSHPLSLPIEYADSAYTPYSSQSFPSQQADNAAQLNQMAFAANSAAVAPYLSTQVAQNFSLNISSCRPTIGSQGTKVSVKATSQYNLFSGEFSASTPYAWLIFGTQRCSMQISSNGRDENGNYTYTLTAEAPPFLSTGCPSLSNVPLTLALENASGDEIARVPNVAVFSYHHGQGSVAAAGAADNVATPGPGSPKPRSPVHQGSPPHSASQPRLKPGSPVAQHSLTNEASTSAYTFSPNNATTNTATHVQQSSAAVPADFATPSQGGAYGQGNTGVMSSYRSPALADHYQQRAPPALRSPHSTNWYFGSPMDPMRTGASVLAGGLPTSTSRPAPLSMEPSHSEEPRLVRTSTLAQPAGGYPGYGVYQEKASIKFVGNLASMAENWTPEEWENKRRLVLFKKKQTGSVLTVSFQAVSPAERPPHSICISCIWWEEKQACYVTSVDTIHLLEQLLAAPNRFGVDEKNRIRRNLEGFRPATVSKSRAESEEFFKVIMGFGNPKPRNIEKDVKVFQWKDLGQALQKIVSKYSASSVMPPTTSTHIPPSLSLGAYPALPATPVSTASSSSSDAACASGYGGHYHHQVDNLTSPRSLPGTSSWQTQPYSSSASRTMSQSLKTTSPVADSGLRMSSTLLVVYDHRGATHSLTSPYGLSTSPSTYTAPPGGAARHGHGHGHVHAQAAAAAYPAHHSHHSHHNHQQQHQHHGLSHSAPHSGQMRSWDPYPAVAPEGYASQSGAGGHASTGQVYSGGGGAGGGGGGASGATGDGYGVAVSRG